MKKFWDEIVGENQDFTAYKDEAENLHCLIEFAYRIKLEHLK